MSDLSHLTNGQLVGRGLECLAVALKHLVDEHLPEASLECRLDSGKLLHAVWDNWNSVFQRLLPRGGRNWISELRETRNTWAHKEPFSNDDTFRALDTASRLLADIQPSKQTQIVRLKDEARARLTSSRGGAVTVRSPKDIKEGRVSHKEVVLSYLRKISPKWATNSAICQATEIKPHQQVFQITSRLRIEGAVEAHQHGREWQFRARA